MAVKMAPQSVDGSATSPAKVGRRRALVVCNGKFDDQEFGAWPGVAVDYASLQTALGGDGAGFEVRALLDGGFIEVRKEIAKICEESDEHDTLLFYYSGTSFVGRDQMFYMPVRDSSRRYVDSTAIDADFVLRHLRQGRCKKIVLMVDACYSGAFFTNNRGIPDGLFAIMACGATETVPDTPRGGALTQALVAALQDPKSDRDGDGLLSTDEVFESMKATMKKDLGKVTPQKWSWNVRDLICMASAATGVFLSYCREDVELAKTIKSELERRGLSVWLDLEGIQAGNWKEVVTQNLSRSRCVLFLLTRASLQSGAVKKELEFATMKKVPLIPIVPETQAEMSIPDWYHFDYGPIHRRTISFDQMDRSMDDLVAAIRSQRPR